MSWISRTGPTVLERLLAQTQEPTHSPLICTTPYFAPVAELWPGPVVYWLTDLIAEYSSANRSDVHKLDKRMCAAATLVCPNSRRLEQYLIETAGCDRDKIQIVPNATRIANLLPHVPDRAKALPLRVQNLGRPVAGVIGNLAGNMDWVLLQQLVDCTPWLHWLFVGPVDMHIVDRKARAARTSVMQHSNTNFVGRQSYGALAGYARSFDVAVLPYRRCEPTYSGSSTRFYEHLAACRPMLATRGLEELQHKTPLLRLFDTAEEGVQALEQLRSQNFDDGRMNLRWQASQEGTWHARAQTIQDALARRLDSFGSSNSKAAA
jgi:glycosyltransferase involved in cell wall biosynthesis